MDTRIQKHTPPRTPLRCFRKSPENWPWLLWLLWWLSLSPIMAIISGAFPCALLSAQRSVYPNVSCGEHSREASSINTLLSLTPSLIFSPFYHSRSFPRLSDGLSGWNRKRHRLNIIMCLFWRPMAVWHPNLCWCLLLLELLSCSVVFLPATTSVTNYACNLFTLKEVPEKWDVNNFCQ